MRKNNHILNGPDFCLPAKETDSSRRDELSPGSSFGDFPTGLIFRKKQSENCMFGSASAGYRTILNLHISIWGSRCEYHLFQFPQLLIRPH